MREPEEPRDLADEVSEQFTQALVWAAEATTPVAMGWRMVTLLHAMRPELLEGMPLKPDRELRNGLRDALGNADPLMIGAGFWPVLAWCRKCTSLSQMGMRGFAMIYVLRRDLLRTNTNAAIAAKQNKTRQAFNRTVQNFRDTFRGFRNAVMRGEKTRTKCRNAQTQD